MLAPHLVSSLQQRAARLGLTSDDLLFFYRPPTGPKRRTLPDVLPDPATLGFTEPNAKGRRYRHGTPNAYGTTRCRCRHCKNAVAAYRASRRAAGKDSPRIPRSVDTDGISATTGSAPTSGRRPSPRPISDSTSGRTTCVTRMRHGYWLAGPTCKSSRSGWATPASALRRSTCTPFRGLTRQR